ncbi:acyl-CoA synthetase [Gilliamella sp. Pas-s95]|uniref:acyl-CoA synthetase n=1 Tax=Gilliamella sp. Pas-s95 TaxID=2687317 RepID=UPI0013211ED2|nr:acyl-CoA synthetase [Gilliamella sp. Pas-s95]MWN04791.1 AMP-binding protein [Gilliamella sp. Pas-s95]
MAHSSKTTTLVPLSQQLSRSENDIIAFRKHQPLTVNDLKKQVWRIYSALNHYSNQYWALSMQDSFNFVAGLLALLYAGKMPKLLNPYHQEIQHYYNGLLTDNINSDEKFLTDKIIIQINQLDDTTLVDDYQCLNTEFKQQILTLFTSGSTGLPKPIDKSVSQLEKEIQILIDNWGSFSNDLFVASVSHEHMYGLTFKIMLSLSSKIPFLCEPVVYQEQLAKYQQKQIIYITTPSIIKNLDNNLPPIKCDKVISSGGKLSYKEALYCQQNFNVLPNEIYGSSETGIIATRQQHTTTTPWQLFSSIHIEQAQTQQPLLISPLLAKPEPLNDKIKKVDDRHFHLYGRQDKIVKISENRVSLTYIERKIQQLKQVNEVIIIPLEQNNRTILGAVITLSPTYKSLLKQYNHLKLTQYFRLLLKDILSLNEIPKKWRFVELIPKNSQEKCTYIELKALFDATKKNNE